MSVVRLACSRPCIRQSLPLVTSAVLLTSLPHCPCPLQEAEIDEDEEQNIVLDWDQVRACGGSQAIPERAFGGLHW